MIQLTSDANGRSILVNPAHIMTVEPSSDRTCLIMVNGMMCLVKESYDAIIEQLAHEYTLQDVSKALNDIAERIAR